MVKYGLITYAHVVAELFIDRFLRNFRLLDHIRVDHILCDVFAAIELGCSLFEIFHLFLELVKLIKRVV